MERKMRIEIENMVGGDCWTFRSLTGLARVVCRYRPHGGWVLRKVSGVKTSDVRRVIWNAPYVIHEFPRRPRRAHEWRSLVLAALVADQADQ
jgi:hypothetical protein